MWFQNTSSVNSLVVPVFFIVVPVLSELSLQQPKLAVSFNIFTFGSSRKRGSWRKRGWHCAIVHLGSNVVYIIVAQTLSTNVYSTLYIEVQPSPVPSSSSPWPRQPACPLLQLQYVIMCTRGCLETEDRALQDQPG